MRFAIGVITDNGTIAKTEYFTSLLTDNNTVNKFLGTVAFCKFIRIGVCFDGCTEFLCRIQVKVLHIVCIKCRSLCTGRTFSNCGKTIPCDTIVVYAIGLEIKNTVLYTSFV